MTKAGGGQKLLWFLSCQMFSLTTFVIKFEYEFYAFLFFLCVRKLKPTTHMRNDSGSEKPELMSCGSLTTHMRIDSDTVGPELMMGKKNKTATGIKFSAKSFAWIKQPLNPITAGLQKWRFEII